MTHDDEKSQRQGESWMYDLGSMVEPSDPHCPTPAAFKGLAELPPDDAIFMHLAECGHCQSIAQKQRGITSSVLSERIFEEVWEKAKPLAPERKTSWVDWLQRWFTPRPVLSFGLPVALILFAIGFYQWGGQASGRLGALAGASVEIHSLRSGSAPAYAESKETEINTGVIQSIVLKLNTKGMDMEGLTLQLLAVPTSGGQARLLQSTTTVKADGVHFVVDAKQNWLDGDHKSGYLAVVDLSDLDQRELPSELLEAISKGVNFSVNENKEGKRLRVSDILGYDILWIAPFELIN